MIIHQTHLTIYAVLVFGQQVSTSSNISHEHQVRHFSERGRCVEMWFEITRLVNSHQKWRKQTRNARTVTRTLPLLAQGSTCISVLKHRQFGSVFKQCLNSWAWAQYVEHKGGVVYLKLLIKPYLKHEPNGPFLPFLHGDAHPGEGKRAREAEARFPCLGSGLTASCAAAIRTTTTSRICLIHATGYNPTR